MSEVRLGLIGGSGLGEALSIAMGDGQSVVRHDIDTPFGRPSDAIVETRWGELPIFALSRHGPGHLLNPANVPYRANLFALKRLGVTHILATGAVGSLRQEIKPRDLVVCDQIIDKTFRRPATFFENAAVHVEMAEPFCPVLRRILVEAGSVQAAGDAPTGTADATGAAATDPAPVADPPAFRVHDGGCYVCMEGPAFSTRSESLMHRLWGGDLIGMTAMPEAKLAREAEIPYAMAALVTDYDSWKPHAVKEGEPADPLKLLAEIIGHLNAATANAMTLLRLSAERIAADPARLAACPASRALELAIWSDKSKVPADDIQRLAPLWGKYFPDDNAL